MAQLPLFQDDYIKKSITIIPIEQLKPSRFNPRRNRSDEYVSRLAQRIAQNGFEITRALWVYRNGDGYEVFAGGTRLEAAKRATLKKVPVVLHEGLSDEQVVRLADEDNENDEYHEPVSPVDVWANYAWLADKENGMGWTQGRIAEAKGLKDNNMVSRRIKLHGLSDDIKQFMFQGSLEEAHLIVISSLCVETYFAPWLASTQAWQELSTKAVRDKSKNGKKTVAAVKKDVDTWKAFISEAERTYESFAKDVTLYDLDKDPPEPYPFDAQDAFVKDLASRQARSMSKVREAARSVRLAIKQNLEDYQTYIKQESQEAAQKALQAEHEAALLAKFIKGDCLDILDDWQFGKIRLLLLDPPYGKDYQSNRRWNSPPPDKIKGDAKSEAPVLLDNAISRVVTHLEDNAHVLVFCDWQNEPEAREILSSNGLKIKGSLIWAKEEHSAGDIKGSFGPSHERIIHAVQGSPRVTPRIRDVLEESRTKKTSHPNEKPVLLLQSLITSTTDEGNLVVDLFAGCASTLVAAMRLEREFFGVEIDENYHEEGCMRLLTELEKGSN